MSSPDAPARLTGFGFWLVLSVAAIVLRLAVALAIPYEPTADAAWYHEAAVSLARGQGLVVDGEVTAYRLPGYPFLLSLTYRLFGAHHQLAWMWGLVATALIGWMVLFIARRLYGRDVARLAAIGTVLYPALILRTGQVMSDLPFLAGCLVVTAAALSPSSRRSWHAGLTGAGIGLLTLTRGAGVVLAALVPAIWLLRRVDGRTVVVNAVLLYCALAACLAPWLARNDRRFGQATLTTNIGLNAYIGHHRGASGGYDFDLTPQLPAAADTWNEAAIDRELLRQAVTFAREHPLEDLALVPKKVAHLYAFETSAVTALFQGERRASSRVKYALHGASQLAYLVVLGLFLLRLVDIVLGRARPAGAQWVGWIAIACFTGVSLIFFGQDRFRLPILPWMILEGCAQVAGRARLSVPPGDGV